MYDADAIPPGHSIREIVQETHPHLLNLAEVAELLSRATGTIRALVRRGRFPRPRFILGMRFWDRQEVETASLALDEGKEVRADGGDAYTLAEVAELTGRKPKNVYSAAREGRFPAPSFYTRGRYGLKERWERSVIEVYLQSAPPVRSPYPAGHVGLGWIYRNANIRRKRTVFKCVERGELEAPRIHEGRPCWPLASAEAFATDYLDKHEQPPPDPVPSKADWRAWVPTDAMPGSADKLAILEERASLRLPLFHRGDADHSPVNERGLAS